MSSVRRDSVPLPVLLKPRVWSFKNRWRGTLQLKNQAGRDIVVILLSLIVILTIYRGTLSSLENLSQHSAEVYMHPSMTLGAILSLLFFMLLFTMLAGLSAETVLQLQL